MRLPTVMFPESSRTRTRTVVTHAIRVRRASEAAAAAGDVASAVQGLLRHVEACIKIGRRAVVGVRVGRQVLSVTIVLHACT